MTCQMVDIVAQYERTCTNQLGPHGRCGNERPGGCAQINFPVRGQRSCPNAMDQLLLLKVLTLNTPGRSVGAGIGSANDSHTGVACEATFSIVWQSRTLVPHSYALAEIGTIFAEDPLRGPANEFVAGSSRIEVLVARATPESRKSHPAFRDQSTTAR
jgi:hypothetical protein